MPESRGLFDLTGCVALVTGSTRGLGNAIAEALATAGATVAINGRSGDAVDRAVTELRERGIDAHPAPADVTNADAVEAIVSRLEADVGPLDILVNNAGAQHRAPLLDFPHHELLRLIEINLVAPFLVAQAVGHRMVPRGRGKIINICSVMSELARPTITPSTATKGGLKMLTRGLCADLGPEGIQVNAIAPGYFDTDMNAALVADEEFSAWVAQRTPARRWGRLDELGGAAVFLASDASSFVNGQILYVDGGMTAVV